MDSTHALMCSRRIMTRLALAFLGILVILVLHLLSQMSINKSMNTYLPSSFTTNRLQLQVKNYNNMVGHGHIIPISVLHDRFHTKTEKTCHIRRMCSSSCSSSSGGSIRNSSSSSGSNETDDPMREATTLSQWLRLVNSEQLRGVPLFAENEYVFPWEGEYLRTAALEDIRTLPDLDKSKVYPACADCYNDIIWNSSSDGAKMTLRLVKDEPSIFRVDLVDSGGRPRSAGGDEVRAWISGTETARPRSDSGDRNGDGLVSATGMVNDLGNGSYLVTITPVWRGIAQLHVAVTYPREYIRSAIHHYRIGSHRFVFGKFQWNDIKEVTLCHPTPNVPGRPCICNFTKAVGVHYYCGKPLDTRLTCEDWVSFNTVPKPGFKDMTTAEILMDENISRPALKSTLKQKVRIQIYGKAKDDKSLPPCVNTSRVETWTRPSPRGMWTGNRTHWKSLICRESEMTDQWIRRCLASTRVWLIGDSNVRNLASFMHVILGCPEIVVWPSASECHNWEHDVSIHFRTHEYPLYVKGVWLDLLKGGLVTDTLDSIPPTGKHVVVLHYYLHFVSSHLSVLYQRLYSVKTALRQLIERNPRVLVAVVGPHTSAVEWNRSHLFGGDVLGSFARSMYLEVFRDLRRHVLFLDGWDMTVSLENEHFHPSKAYLRALWRSVLSFKCL